MSGRVTLAVRRAGRPRVGAVLAGVLAVWVVASAMRASELDAEAPASTRRAGAVPDARIDSMEARIAGWERRLRIPETPPGTAEREFAARYEALRAREARLVAHYDSAYASYPNGAPLRAGRITSGYTPRRLHPIARRVLPHWGLDIAAPHGDPVYAAADGVVSHTFRNATYGIGVDVRHGGEGEFITRYAHFSRLAAREGARVKKGEVIGYVGSTGRSTGNHLHFEVYVRGPSGFQSRDPIRFLPVDGSLRF